MNKYQRLIAQIDLDAIANNIKQIKKRIKPNTKIMAIVKADAYGHGALEVSKVCLFNGANWLGVATLDEGIELRQGSIQVPILILGHTVESQLETAILNDLTQTVYSYEIAQIISNIATKLKKRALIHIKIDTGMSRLGFLPNDESIQIINKIYNLPNIDVTGIFTHFAAADEKDKTFTNLQYDKFLYITNSLETMWNKRILRHCGNSATIIDMPLYQLDMVRAGIIIYGLLPSKDVAKNIDLKPAMTLKSQIVYIKELEPNSSIGYNRTYFTSKPTLIATIPIGYADGYSRSLSNKARVIINGEYANVVGNVCMDQMMVDVSHIKGVNIFDSVTLIGSSNGKFISADELANIEGTINYEVVCNISKRVPRVYIRDGQIINTKKY